MAPAPLTPPVPIATGSLTRGRIVLIPVVVHEDPGDSTVVKVRPVRAGIPTDRSYVIRVYREFCYDSPEPPGEPPQPPGEGRPAAEGRGAPGRGCS